MGSTGATWLPVLDGVLGDGPAAGARAEGRATVRRRTTETKQHHKWRRRGESRYWDCVQPGCGEFIYDMRVPARIRMVHGPWVRVMGMLVCPRNRGANKPTGSLWTTPAGLPTTPRRTMAKLAKTFAALPAVEQRRITNRRLS
jgi:hypothetical protein